MLERKRPQVPNIPGVVKGGDFSRGKIELAREIWASRRRLSFPDRKGDLFIIAKDAESYLSLPILGLPEIPAESVSSWVPRVEPVSGAVFTSRWQSVKGVVDSQEFIIIGGDKSNRGIPLEERAKSWEVIRLVPQRLEGGLEGAMRQQDEIIHDTKIGRGVEQQRIESALSAIHDITSELIEGEVDRHSLEVMSRQAEKILRNESLLSGTDEIWRKFVGYTLRSAKVDSLGRVNPMISRVLARAAYLQVIERELILREARHKASCLFKYLALVRSCTRIRIESAVETLARIGGFGTRRGHEIFREGKKSLDSRTAWEVGQEIKAVSQMLLAPIQAAPYLLPSAFAEAALTGSFYKNRAEQEELQEILEYSGLGSEFSRGSVEEYLRSRNAFSAQRRMRHAYNCLLEVLKDPDNKETVVFD